MSQLYKHQEYGIQFLSERPAALLADEQGTGKTRQAILAAWKLFNEQKIDRVLVFCPAAVRFAWGEELGKLIFENLRIMLLAYNTERQVMGASVRSMGGMPISIVSYGLLPLKHHVRALEKWCASGDTLLICDESSFIKSREAQTTKGALDVRQACMYCWLLTGTPIANTPLDLWAQGVVMAGGHHGPLAGFKNFYHFRNSFGAMGGYKMKQWIPDMEKMPKLQARFAPFALRREKKDCLDLPPKSYVSREVALDPSTWKVYQELKREALLTLPPDESRPEPNAAVRIMRLAQLTSGHVGIGPDTNLPEAPERTSARDVSNEKLAYITNEILEGEFAAQRALIMWCRWRRERERLAHMLSLKHKVTVLQLYGGQSERSRNQVLEQFQALKDFRRVLIAQPHAGGYGLTLISAHTAIYLSNDFSYVTRVQSEDRCHRVGQINPVTYVDVLATGPRNERTIDHVIVSALKVKEDLARWTCAAWKRALEK